MEQPSLHKFQSKQLVTDYIIWRLAKSGYCQWNIMNKLDLNRNSKNLLFATMRQMSYAFELKYTNEYTPLVDQLNLTTMANCKDIFLNIVIELFQIKTVITANSTNECCINDKNDAESLICDSLETKFELKNPNTKIPQQPPTWSHFECNWGRIIGLFAFAGCLSIKCYEKRIPGLVHDIINWLVQLLNEDDYKISQWIESKGCWVIFKGFPVVKF
jgi:hypothetical protein